MLQHAHQRKSNGNIFFYALPHPLFNLPFIYLLLATCFGFFFLVKAKHEFLMWGSTGALCHNGNKELAWKGTNSFFFQKLKIIYNL